MKSAAGWMVVRVRPQLLLRALKNLRQQGCETYVPRALIPQKSGKRRIQPLFVGYVFVRHPDAQWHFLRGTFGVLDFFVQGDRPAFVPDPEIEKLRAREDERGLIKLQPRFKPGEAVHVDGMLEAIYEGMSSEDRAIVLMAMMGRWVRTEVSAKRVTR